MNQTLTFYDMIWRYRKLYQHMYYKMFLIYICVWMFFENSFYHTYEILSLKSAIPRIIFWNITLSNDNNAM